MSLIIPTPAQSYRESYKHFAKKKKRTPESPFPRLPPVCVSCVYPCLPPNTLLSPRPTMNALPFGRQKQPDSSSAEYPQPISSVHPLPSQPTKMHVSPAQRRSKVPSQNAPDPFPCPCLYMLVRNVCRAPRRRRCVVSSARCFVYPSQCHAKHPMPNSTLSSRPPPPLTADAPPRPSPSPSASTAAPPGPPAPTPS